MQMLHMFNNKKNKMLYFKYSFLLTAFITILCFWPALQTTNAQALQEQMIADPLLTDEHYALPAFSTHMPVIVLDMPVDAVPLWDDGYFLQASILSFNNNSANKLQDAPELLKAVKIRNLTDKMNESQLKNDYFLRFENQQNLLGIKAAKEYFLLGSRHDKSLIRTKK